MDARVQADLKRQNRRALKIVGAVILTAIAMGVVGMLVGESPQPASVTHASVRVDDGKRAERDSLIKQSITVGIITKLACDSHEAYLTPYAWMKLDAQAKEGLTVALAAHCEDQQGGNRITILDAQSGRELAKFGWSGYSVR